MSVPEPSTKVIEAIFDGVEDANERAKEPPEDPARAAWNFTHVASVAAVRPYTLSAENGSTNLLVDVLFTKGTPTAYTGA